MIVKEICIDKFRSFKNVDIPLSEGLTVIAGQNGCGKSTLLGMIAQPFKFDVPDELKDFFGFKAKSEFGDIFKLSPEKDIPGEHVYHLKLSSSDFHPDGDSVVVKSFLRSETDKATGKKIKADPNRPWTFIRFVTGKSRTGKESGGNIDNVPVIYLGLSRLYPIGESKEVKVYNKELKELEKKKLIETHKSVLKLNHIAVQQESLKGLETESKKITIAYENGQYDAYANSAGQDNLGKILLAMLYIRKLKQVLKEDYKGAFLLIDEIDATLFPAAQEELVKELISFSKDTNTQIVVTTHSQIILQYIIKRYQDKQNLAQIIYLRSKNNQSDIEIKPSPSLEYIINDLNLTRSDKKDLVKVNVFREDGVTESFVKKILGNNICKHLNFLNIDLGHGSLKTLSQGKDAFFNNAVYIVDGEVDDSDVANMKHALKLPGGDAPENCIYDCIFSIPDDDVIWDNESGRTKQKCFEHCANKAAAKEWFRSLPKREQNTFINKWKGSISEEIVKWKNSFKALYNEQAEKIGADKLL